MKILLVILILLIIFFLYKGINNKNSKNKTIKKFKNNLLSKESNIKKIFLRDEERTSSNPNIDIRIGNYESENNINRKSNIHRARLSKFKKSKLNGEMIFKDDNQRVYKIYNGNKVYL